jgi:processive 1,2-diacylglycerol beta-glucosyltransferase
VSATRRSPDGPSRTSAAPPGIRVTILTSSYGGGHAMVARTVEAALLELRPDWQIEIIDFFDAFVGTRFNAAISTAYVQSVRKAPFLYGAFYYLTQKIGERSALQSRLNRVGRQNLREYLRRQPRDLVVNCYPTPAGVLSDLKLSGAVRIPSVTIMTDFAVHSQWIHSGTELYIVGNEHVRQGLADRGTAPERVLATGIPIRPCFRPPGQRPPDGPVLVTVGAVGMLKGAADLCRALTETVDRTVVVCGHDAGLRQRLAPIEALQDGRLQVHGFVDDIHRHMCEARLLVGKPGGVTASEALAVGLPMVLCGMIPGQEQENAKFLVAGAAARAPENRSELCRVVKHLLAHPQELAEMSAKARALGRPDSARDAATAIVEVVEAGHGQQ